MRRHSGCAFGRPLPGPGPDPESEGGGKKKNKKFGPARRATTDQSSARLGRPFRLPGASRRASQALASRAVRLGSHAFLGRTTHHTAAQLSSLARSHRVALQATVQYQIYSAIRWLVVAEGAGPARRFRIGLDGWRIRHPETDRHTQRWMARGRQTLLTSPPSPAWPSRMVCEVELVTNPRSRLASLLSVARAGKAQRRANASLFSFPFTRMFSTAKHGPTTEAGGWRLVDSADAGKARLAPDRLNTGRSSALPDGDTLGRRTRAVAITSNPIHPHCASRTTVANLTKATGRWGDEKR